MDSQAVEHLSIVQQVAASAGDVALIQHLTQIDFYLDSTSLLPVARALIRSRLEGISIGCGKSLRKAMQHEIPQIVVPCFIRRGS
jgi:hypothetical protein